MLGHVDLCRPQLGDQEVAAAEDVQRLEAVVVVVTMEEALLLVAVHGVVGGVEVEEQLLRGMGWEAMKVSMRTWAIRTRLGRSRRFSRRQRVGGPRRSLHRVRSGVSVPFPRGARPRAGLQPRPWG